MTRSLESLAEEQALSAAMAAIALGGVLTGCRLIREGDEAQLLPAEARSLSARQPAMRRASGAARFVARALLADLGIKDFAIPRTPSGAPAWPEGITGSLAHDDEMAVAAVATVSAVRSLGIDVEPSLSLPDDILAIVATDADRMDMAEPRLAGRLLFSAKEAVYKATFPLDREILGYEDIAVDLGVGRATTRTGRRVNIAYCVAPRVVVLAVVDTD